MTRVRALLVIAIIAGFATLVACVEPKRTRQVRKPQGRSRVHTAPSKAKPHPSHPRHEHGHGHPHGSGGHHHHPHPHPHLEGANGHHHPY